MGSFRRNMTIERFHLVSGPEATEKVFVMPGHPPMTKEEYERAFAWCLNFTIANDPREGGRWVDPSFVDL